MRKVDAFGEQANCVPFMVDRPRMERAIDELVRFAATAALSSDDLIQMLDGGMSVPEILRVVEEKSKRLVQ